MPLPKAGNFFEPIVKWITYDRAGVGNNRPTGRRKPISMSGAGKAVWRYTAPTALFFDGPDRLESR
jgi:hypothetical protein